MRAVLAMALVTGLVALCASTHDAPPAEPTGSPALAGPPKLLVAFFGLDDALPAAAAFVCPRARGRDGMSVVFSHEIENATLDAADFLVVLRSGARKTPLCATRWPANEENEDRSVLLIGDLGGSDDPPVRVEVTGELLAEDGESLQGLVREVTPLEDGPFLAYAGVVPLDPAEGQFPVGGRGGPCPLGPTRQIVRITWSGGVRAASGAELGDPERGAFEVRVRQLDGNEPHVTPIALADLGDQDNNVDLCLGAVGTPLAVRVAAGTAIDPRGDPNPETEVEVTGPSS